MSIKWQSIQETKISINCRKDTVSVDNASSMNENLQFLQAFLKNPLKVGAVAPVVLISMFGVTLARSETFCAPSAWRSAAWNCVT